MDRRPWGLLSISILAFLASAPILSLAEQTQDALQQPPSVNDSSPPPNVKTEKGIDLWKSQFPADAPNAKNEASGTNEAPEEYHEFNQTSNGRAKTSACDYYYGVGYALGPDDVDPFADGYGFYYNPETRWLLRDATCPCSPLLYGGWSSFGYHDNNTRLSFTPGDLKAYNDLPDRLNLHQEWLFIAKEADGSNGLDWGFRTDTVYGTDAQKLQATGNRGASTPGFGAWDASFDHGTYGWAIPQAYGQLALGDWSVIGGYFLSPIGYESSLAPENFFYSHSLTMFNSEPFTHTGVLVNYNGLEHTTIYGGWTLGWDTAFQENLDGNAFLGGFSHQINDDVLFSYFATAGNFGFYGQDGYDHSVVTQVRLTDALKYVAQSDYRTTNDTFATPGFDVEEYGLSQYLLYRINACLGAGSRIEWWKSNRLTGEEQSYYEFTTGLNIRPITNIVVRPEIRYDWTPGADNFVAVNNENYNQWTFGIDCVLTY
jgi:hypothetical protein